MSGAELSRQIGVSSGVFSQWNTKRTKPSLRNISKIAAVLDVPVGVLMPDSETEATKKASSEDEAVSMAFPTDLVRLTDKEQRDLYAVFSKALKRMDITPGFAVVRAKVDPSMINRIQKSLLSMASREELLRLARFLECTSEAEPIVRGLAPLEERLAAIYRSYHYAVLAIPIEQIESYSHILQYDENSK